MTSKTEVFSSLLNWNIWGRLALDDLWLRYRRTLLGPVWITIAQGIWIFGIYLAREAFGGTNLVSDAEYLQYLTLGLLIYNVLANALVDGPVVLQRSAGLILSYPYPASLFIMRGIASTLLTFAHAMPVLIIVLVATGFVPSVSILAAVPGLIALMLFVFGAYFLLGTIGARFRDIAPVTNSISALFFILTPVMWLVTPENTDSLVVVLNPLYYLIEGIRGPFLGSDFYMLHTLIALLIGASAAVLGLLVYFWQEKDIAYWL
jgi:ABC-2 type transport system permease protein